VVDELRTDVTKTRKDGSRGRMRIDYGDHRDPQPAVAWLWKFVLCRAAGYAESACGGPRFPAQRAGGDERLGITQRFQEDEQLVEGPVASGLVLGGAVRRAQVP
jgi:hypothetical protein